MPASLSPDARPDPAEARLPAVETLMAGTLALMTAVTERCALGHPPACHAQSRLMLGKLRQHLDQLCGHPALSPTFRLSLARIRGHWQRLLSEQAAAGPEPPGPPAALH